MAPTYRLTLTQERILDGDRFGLRQAITAQEPAGAVPDAAVFVFETTGGTGAAGESYLRVSALAEAVPGVMQLAYNPCDTVVFTAAHGLSAGDQVTFRRRLESSTATAVSFPSAWVSLADAQSGTVDPTVTRTVASVSGLIVRLTEPLWTPVASVYLEKVVASGTAPGFVVSVRRANPAAGTYRDCRFYRAFDSVSDSVNASLAAKSELTVLLKSLVKGGKRYTQGTNPEITDISV